MSQTVVLNVRMSCEGCSGAVKRVLSKMEGVESFDIDMKEQKVTVIGNVEPEAVLQTVAKTGKKSSFWEEEVKTDAKAAEIEVETAEKTETKVEQVDVEEKTAVKTGTKVEEEVEVELTETTSGEIEKTKPAEVEAKEVTAPASVGIETKPAEVAA